MDDPSILNPNSLPKSIAGDPVMGMVMKSNDNYSAALDTLTKDKEAALAPLKKQIDQGQQELSAMASKGPEQAALPENDAKHIDPKQMSSFFSTFLTLGALGGLLTRAPMTAALNNMTAAMKGLQEGDDEQFKRSTDEFNANYAKAAAANKAKLDAFDKVFNDKTKTIAQKIEEAKLVFHQYGDQLNVLNAQQGNQRAMFQSMDASRKMQQEADQAAATLKEHAADRIERAREANQRARHEDAALEEIKNFHQAEADHWKAEAAAKVSPSELKGVPVKVQQEYRGNDKLVSDLEGMKSALSDPVVAEKIRNHGMRTNNPLVGDTAVERDFAMQGLTEEQKNKMQKYFTLESLYRAGEFDKGGVQMTKIKREILDPIYKIGGGYNTENITRAINANIPEFQRANAKLEAEYPAFKKIGERLSAVGGTPHAVTAAPVSMSFSNEAEAEAAEKAGTLLSGTRVTIGGKPGVWH